MTTTNSVVANAIKAQAVRNSVEVEISPGYAARVQHAMRDAARAVSGVRMTSTNTLECRDEDAADDVIDILKQAGLPDGEVWTNARRAAANAIGDLDFDMKGVYETAKKMLAAGATHKGGYHWSVPKTYATGAGVVASRVGGAVKVVRDDPDRAGFVIAEITDPLAQALERKGVPNACRTARNDMTSKLFGSVKVYYNPGGPTPLELKFVDDIDGEKTFGEVLEVLKDAEDYRKTYKARIAGLDQAIAWIKQYAK